MSDIQPDAAPEAEAVAPDAAPDATTAPAAVPAPETAAEAEVDLEAPIEGFDTLPEATQREIKKLRQESQSLRGRLGTYKETIGAFAEQDQAVLVDLLRELQADPTAGATRMRALADALLGDGPAADKPAEPEAEADPNRPLTAAELDKMLSERESKAKEAQSLKDAEAKVVQDAQSLGYTEGTRGYISLLLEAKQHGGDLEAAHKALEAEKQTIIDQYLASRKADAEGSITVGNGAGAAPANSKGISTMEQARASLEARLNAVQ